MCVLAVSFSRLAQMGGAAALMYVIGCRLRGAPHHVSKLLLLSPAGIHTKARLPYC
jgi:hypothetical protein